jgi:protein-arginine kinase activator protein McsA
MNDNQIKIQELQCQIEQLWKEMQELVLEAKYQRAAELRDEAQKLRLELAAIEAKVETDT